MTDPLAVLETSCEGPVVTVRVHGEVDASNVTTLAQEIRKAAGSADSLRLDLTGVSFIDSAGLRMLQQLQRARAGAPTPLAVTVHPDSTVRQLLEITALDRVLDVVTALPS
jgi:anti-sigma B factor antagonist